MIKEFREKDIVKIRWDCSGVKMGEICDLHYGNGEGYLDDRLWARSRKTDRACRCEENWKLIETSIKELNKRCLKKRYEKI